MICFTVKEGSDVNIAIISQEHAPSVRFLRVIGPLAVILALIYAIEPVDLSIEVNLDDSLSKALIVKFSTYCHEIVP